MPSAFAYTNPFTPSPTWQSTHATCRCVAACQAVNCGVIGVWHTWPQNGGDSIQCRLL